MQITILTIFPEFFTSPLQSSILKRAQLQANTQFKIVDIREFATDKHQTTDDRPFGGGPGMVMKIEPIDQALASLQLSQSRRVILTSAQGQSFTQAKAREYAELQDLVIICGHYEGVDERVAEHLVDEEVRIGDYVLTGGEPAALVIADAVTRLLPGTLGNDQSNQGESHDQPGKLGYPQYTRPELYKDWGVPEVLLSGNHDQIKAWREDQRKSK